jgi:AAA lid domain
MSEGYVLQDEVKEKASQHLEMLRRAKKHFGNGRAVRNLFGEMKMLLARRVMGQSGTSESLDKETLVTFSLEDVPGFNLSETLFHTSSLTGYDSRFPKHGIAIPIDPPKTI